MKNSENNNYHRITKYKNTNIMKEKLLSLIIVNLFKIEKKLLHNNLQIKNII